MQTLNSNIASGRLCSPAGWKPTACRTANRCKRGNRLSNCTHVMTLQQRIGHFLNVHHDSCKPWIARSSSSPDASYQFKDNDFHQVDFMPHPYGPFVMLDRQQGTVIFRRADDVFPSESSETLEVFVGGDTCTALHYAATSKSPERPMVLDLLFQVLERGQSVSKPNWHVLRVAIIDMRNEIYIGRLFIGDPDTKKVMWDCDCRPSDASWLALQTGAPIYIHKNVWRQNVRPLGHTAGYAAVQTDAQRKPQQTFLGSSGSLPPPPPPPPASTPLERASAAADRGISMNAASRLKGLDVMAVQPDDIEVIKLLKRELKVAVQEENYAEAIRIRDHPFMRLYSQIIETKKKGDSDAAWEMLCKLRDMVAENDAQSSAQPH